MKKYRFCIVDGDKKKVIRYSCYYNCYKGIPDPFDETYLQNIGLSTTQIKRLERLREGNIVTIGTYLSKGFSGYTYLAIRAFSDSDIDILNSTVDRLSEINKEIDKITSEYGPILSRLANLRKEKSSLKKAITGGFR